MTTMEVRVNELDHDTGYVYTFYYYDVTAIEVKWVDEAGWYCYVISMKDGSTATFTVGQSSVSYFNFSQNAWLVI